MTTITLLFSLAIIAVAAIAIIRIYVRRIMWEKFRRGLMEAENLARNQASDKTIRTRLQDMRVPADAIEEIMQVLDSEREFLVPPRKIYRDPKGYYALLSVSAKSSLAEITAAYRRQILFWHPDKVLFHHNVMLVNLHTEKVKQLNEAFETLSNPAKRKLYDDFKS